MLAHSIQQDVCMYLIFGQGQIFCLKSTPKSKSFSGTTYGKQRYYTKINVDLENEIK